MDLLGCNGHAVIVTALELEFADGEYSFDLKLPQMAELQEKCGCGIFALYGRVTRGRHLFGDVAVADPAAGEAYDQDLFETIRLALIGGGKGIVNGESVTVDAAKARKLVERYCHTAPLKDAWAFASAILGARIMGYDVPGEAEAGQAPAPDQTGSASAT